MPPIGSPIACTDLVLVDLDLHRVPGGELATDHDRRPPAAGGERGPDRELDLLRRLLADRDAVRGADVFLDRIVEVEAAGADRSARHRPPIDTTAISDRAPPMSTMRFPIGSWTGRRRADRRGQRLLDKRDLLRARGAERVLERAPLDLRALRRDCTRARAAAGTARRPTFGITSSSIRSVISNSVIVPARSGRTARTLPESSPIRLPGLRTRSPRRARRSA